jgi:PAS domain S-box-containing protein
MSEVYAPVRERLWMTAFLICTLLIGAGASVGLVWRHQRAGFYREKYETAEALGESEKRYRSLFENMLEGYAYCKMIFERDKPHDFIYVDVNNAFDKITGLKNVAGKKVSEVIPGIQESNPELFEIYGRVALTGNPEKFETYVESLGIWFSIAVYSPAREYFVAVFDNITERKRAEEALRESELSLRESQTIAGLGTYALDISSGLWKSSKILDEIFGIDEQYVRSVEGWISLVHPRWREEMAGYFANDVLGKHERFDKEYKIIRNDDKQERWVHGLGELELDAQNRPVRMIGTIRDITDRIQAEEEIIRLNTELEDRVVKRTAQLEAANKELEAFSYSVSHDLRAPLRAIDGFSRIVVEDYAKKLDAEGKRLLNVIRANTQKMDELITDLLSLSRFTRSEMQFSRVDMSKLANSIYQEIASPEVQENFSFLVAAIPDAYCDHSLIRQVWTNLISNAVKFTTPSNVRRIEIGSRFDNGMSIYSIKDSGVGFNSEYTHKLFGVFERLHKAEEFEGTGVGLAIVQRIIHRHGGRVWAEGKVGEGATFFFSIPDRQ